MRKQYFSLFMALGFFFLATFTITQSLHAQTQNHEIGIRLYSLSDFGFLYKKELKNSYMRLRAGILSSNIQIVNREENETNRNEYDYNVNFYAAIGWENRISINENLSFIHGFEPRLNILFNSDTDKYEGTFQDPKYKNLDLFIRPSLGYVIGFHYSLDNFNIGLEFIPFLGLDYRYSKSIQSNDIQEEVSTANSYGLNSALGINNLALTLTYKFQLDKGEKEVE